MLIENKYTCIYCDLQFTWNFGANYIKLLIDGLLVTLALEYRIAGNFCEVNYSLLLWAS